MQHLTVTPLLTIVRVPLVWVGWFVVGKKKLHSNQVANEATRAAWLISDAYFDEHVHSRNKPSTVANSAKSNTTITIGATGGASPSGTIGATGGSATSGPATSGPATSGPATSSGVTASTVSTGLRTTAALVDSSFQSLIRCVSQYCERCYYMGYGGAMVPRGCKAGKKSCCSCLQTCFRTLAPRVDQV